MISNLVLGETPADITQFDLVNSRTFSTCPVF